MLAKRIPIPEVRLNVGFADDRYRGRAGLVALFDPTPEQHWDLHRREEIGSNHQNMRIPSGTWLLAHRQHRSRRGAFADQRGMGDRRAAHSGNRAEPLLQTSIEGVDFRILMS